MFSFNWPLFAFGYGHRNFPDYYANEADDDRFIILTAVATNPVCNASINHKFQNKRKHINDLS
jgi:hypothetical protein